MTGEYKTKAARKFWAEHHDHWFNQRLMKILDRARALFPSKFKLQLLALGTDEEGNRRSTSFGQMSAEDLESFREGWLDELPQAPVPAPPLLREVRTPMGRVQITVRCPDHGDLNCSTAYNHRTGTIEIAPSVCPSCWREKVSASANSENPKAVA